MLGVATIALLAVTARPAVGIVPHPVVNVGDNERDAIAKQTGEALSKHYDLTISKTQPPRDLPDDCVGQPS